MTRMQSLFSRDPSIEAVFHSPNASGFTKDELCRLRRSIDLIPFSLVDAGVVSSTFSLRGAAADSESLNYPRIIGDPCDVSFLGLKKLKDTIWSAFTPIAKHTTSSLNFMSPRCQNQEGGERSTRKPH